MNFIERIGRLVHPSLETESRNQRLQKLLTQYPLTNQLIWYQIIASRGFLEPEERAAITEGYKTYKELFPDAATPVAEILHSAKIPIDANRFFLQKVSFNYDFALGASARFQAAMEEMKQGKRHAVEFDWRVWSVEDWIAYDFFNMSHGNQEIGSNRELLPSPQTHNARVFVTGDSLLIPGSGRIKEIYERQVLPLLLPGEIIKPGKPRFYYGGPHVPNDTTFIADILADGPSYTPRKDLLTERFITL